jgi:hypothetical protein
MLAYCPEEFNKIYEGEISDGLKRKLENNISKIDTIGSNWNILDIIGYFPGFAGGSFSPPFNKKEYSDIERFEIYREDYTTKFELPEKPVDLIVNVNVQYNLEDVRLILDKLNKGGVFITEQSGSFELLNLKEYFEEINFKNKLNHTLINNRREFEKWGCHVWECKEHIGKYIIHDIDSVIYLLRKNFGIYQNFIKNNYLNLRDIEEFIELNGFIECIYHKFYMIVLTEWNIDF